MEFASTNFIWLFLPACLVLFYLAKWVLKDRVRDQICKFILLVASLFFYYMAGLKGLIILVIFILINYQFEVDTGVIQESGDFHQHKVRVPRPVAKQVGIHKPYLDFSFRHNSQSVMLCCVKDDIACILVGQTKQ